MPRSVREHLGREGWWDPSSPRPRARSRQALSGRVLPSGGRAPLGARPGGGEVHRLNASTHYDERPDSLSVYRGCSYKNLTTISRMHIARSTMAGEYASLLIVFGLMYFNFDLRGMIHLLS